jgi:hypothetical protein
MQSMEKQKHQNKQQEQPHPIERTQTIEMHRDSIMGLDSSYRIHAVGR